MLSRPTPSYRRDTSDGDPFHFFLRLETTHLRPPKETTTLRNHQSKTIGAMAFLYVAGCFVRVLCSSQWFAWFSVRQQQPLKPPDPWQGYPRGVHFFWAPFSVDSPSETAIFAQVPSVVTSPADGDAIHPEALQNIGKDLGMTKMLESHWFDGETWWNHDLRKGLLDSMWKSARDLGVMNGDTCWIAEMLYLVIVLWDFLHFFSNKSLHFCFVNPNIYTNLE